MPCPPLVKGPVFCMTFTPVHSCSACCCSGKHAGIAFIAMQVGCYGAGIILSGPSAEHKRPYFVFCLLLYVEICCLFKVALLSQTGKLPASQQSSLPALPLVHVMVLHLGLPGCLMAKRCRSSYARGKITLHIVFTLYFYFNCI